MQIVTSIVIPIVVAIFVLLIEYWVIQPFREKQIASRLINNIQEIPVQNYLQPHKRNLRLPLKNIVVVSPLGIRAFDLSKIAFQPIKFNRLMPALIAKSAIINNTQSFLESEFILYSNWKRVASGELVFPVINKNSVFVLSQYPSFELLEASDEIKDEFSSTTVRKPPIDSKEARLEYEYRLILKLDNISRKVKLVTVKNDKAFYRLFFQCKSIRDVKENGEVLLNEENEVEITVPDEFPMKRPTFRVINKVLHPNISSNGHISFNVWVYTDKNELSLASLCLMAIEMLECQWFDINSPFNLDAANKFRHLKSIFPLDSSNLKGS